MRIRDLGETARLRPLARLRKGPCTCMMQSVSSSPRCVPPFVRQSQYVLVRPSACVSLSYTCTHSVIHTQYEFRQQAVTGGNSLRPCQVPQQPAAMLTCQVPCAACQVPRAPACATIACTACSRQAHVSMSACATKACTACSRPLM